MSYNKLCIIVLLMCYISKSCSQTLPPLCDVLNPIDLGSCLYTVQKPDNAEPSQDKVDMFGNSYSISYSCANETYWDYTTNPKCSVCPTGDPTPDQSYCINPSQSPCTADNQLPLYEKGGIRLDTVECFTFDPTKVHKVRNTSELIICDGDNMRYDTTVGNCVCDNGLTLYSNSYGYYTKKFCYTPLQSQITVRDTNYAIIGGTYQSKAISDLLDVSYSMCPNIELPSKPEWCNTLSNLCTLTNYYGNFQGNTICGAAVLKSSLVNTIRAVATDLDISNKVETSYTFKRGNNAAGSTHLRFGLASYTLNGTLVSFEELKNQFFYCSSEGSVDEDLGSVWLRYGSGFDYRYKCDVSRLFNRGDNLFYDLYILNVRGGNVNGWTKVPIYNKELRGSDGNRINVKGSESPTYVYRFTLFDNLGANTAMGVQAIRYAKDITIRVRARKDDKQRIYLPVVRIEYGEVASGNAGTEEFSIKVEYEHDLSTWNNFQTAWFWIFMVVMFFYWVYSYIRKQRNNARSTEEETLSFESIIRAAVLLISLAGPFCAGCYLAVFGTYWFCFFKFQDVPYVFLPPYIDDVERFSNYYPFECILYVATVCQVIRVIYLVYQQCTCDIFLIDWETPYDTYHIAESKDDDAPQIPVSVWRKLFVANEFNELQTKRRTSFEFSLFFIWFLIEIAGFKKMATQEPAFRDDPTIPVNMFLHCYMILFLWFLVTSLQLIWNYAVYQRFIEEPEESLFIDLCTVAKISLFIMDEKYHGYYFHCHLPGQHADTDMETLLQHLKMPGENLPGGKDSQVYEIFLSKNFKESYFHKFDDDLRSKMQQAGPMGGFFRAFPLCGNGRVPLDPKLVAKIEAFLKEYVEQNNCPVKRTIFEPFPMWKRMIHFPPDMSREEQCWWVPDSNSMLFSSRHSRLLFWGIEYDLMLFHALLWSITYYWWGNEALSATLTYLAARLLYFFRNQFGEGNITMKTNVDGKFLI